MSSRASLIAKPNDSPYYIGLDKVAGDRYNKWDNPNGVIQLGLAENRVSFFVVFMALSLPYFSFLSSGFLLKSGALTVFAAVF